MYDYFQIHEIEQKPWKILDIEKAPNDLWLGVLQKEPLMIVFHKNANLFLQTYAVDRFKDNLKASKMDFSIIERIFISTVCFTMEKGYNEKVIRIFLEELLKRNYIFSDIMCHVRLVKEAIMDYKF